jgi:hypothetical protein
MPRRWRVRATFGVTLWHFGVSHSQFAWVSLARHAPVAAACDRVIVKRLAVLFVVCLAFRVWIAASDAAPASRSLLIDRFLVREEPLLERYDGRRVMLARNARFKKEAWLEAEVHFDRTSGFSYRVVASGGSPLVIRRALIPSLEGEAELWRRGEPDRYGVVNGLLG